MIGFASRYVGLDYAPGEFDCADLAVRVQREIFGRDLQIPANHRLGRRGQIAQITSLRDEIAERVTLPTDGDLALFINGSESVESWHIGTVFLRKQEIWILHNSFRLGASVLWRLDTFPENGMRLEGFYKCK